MSQLYNDSHRALQDEFGTRKLADRAEEAIYSEVMDERAQGYIGSRDYFFLATTDPDGQPSVSYKGGFPGFISIVDERTLVFPNYDGNGMFLSLGNIERTAKVGMLFMDFEKPSRMRVRGEASLLRDGPLVAQYEGATAAIRVEVTGVWLNCPRYVHKHHRVSTSRYVPEAGKEAPLAGWKRIASNQDAITPEDAEKARKEGLISEEQWGAMVAEGHPEA